METARLNSVRAGEGAATLPNEVGRWLAVAQNRIAAGDAAGALEALAGAAIIDIQRYQQTFLAGAAAAAVMADLYQAAFATSGIAAWLGRKGGEPGRPLRVGYVAGSIVDGQSASGTLARFAELHDRSRVEPVVVVVEEMTQRTPPLALLKMPWAPSQRVGGGVLARIAAAGVPVHVVPARGTMLDGARAAVELLRGLELDVAVFVGSPASAIQAATAMARVAPVQVNFHIGVPLLVRGMDAVVYSNPLRERADRAVVAARGITVMGVPTSGADVAAGVNIAAADRGKLGLPGAASGAVVLVSAANKLPERMMHGSFAAELEQFMAARPKAWWVGIGRGNFAGVMQAMRRAGVERRVVLAGAVPDIRPIVKACDLYLNEYPEGGCNTVMEAMGCGVPVAAMSAGTRHAETIGAELVGETAIGACDPGAYWNLVGRWCDEPAERRRVGALQQARALEQFDYHVICRAYEGCYEVAAGR